MRSNDEIMDIFDKLKEEQDLSISEIARRSGMAKSAISRYFNRSREFPLNRVNDFSKIFHVSPEYILGVGTGNDNELINIYEQLNSENKQKLYGYGENLLSEQKSIMKDAPVIYDYTDVVLNGYVAAGTGNYVDDVKETVRIPTSYLPKGSYDVMVKVNGDSMEPAFLDGDYIFIKRVDEFPNGKFAVVIVNNEAFLKKVYKEDNRLRLVSLNSKYNDMYFDETDDIKIVGTVVN